MPEVDFVSLAEMLMRSVDEPVLHENLPVAAETRDDASDARVVGILRDTRLFTARLADAFDEACARLLRELASDVLGRELRLAPCDLASIVRRVLAGAPVIGVRVAAEDALECGDAPVIIDPSLHAGDAIVELRGGAIDARLGVRLSQVLEAFA